MTESSGKKNRVCWAQDNNCSGGISKEHVVSHSIMRAIGPMAMQLGEEVRVFGAKSFVVRSLCRYHNEKLSPFDSEALKLVTTWKKYLTDSYKPFAEIETTYIDIEKIERWFLKTYINYIIMEIALKKNLKVMQPKFQVLKRHLFEDMPIEPPFGVYALKPNPDHPESFLWGYSADYQPIKHLSALPGGQTAVVHSRSSPTTFRMKLFNAELVGFFNLTGLNDQQALDSLLKNTHKSLANKAVYREKIRLGVTHPADIGYNGVRMTRNIQFR